MDSEADLKTVKKMLRSVLLGEKEGVKSRSLLEDYHNLTFNELPYKKLGFSTLEQFIRSIPDVVRVSRDHHGNSVYHGIPEESTEQIHRFVQSQRSKREKKRRIPLKPSARRPIPRPYRSSVRSPRHHRRPPPLAATTHNHISEPPPQRSNSGRTSPVANVHVIPDGNTDLQIRVKNQKRVVVNKRDMVRFLNSAVKENKPREKLSSYQEKYEIAPRFLRQQEQARAAQVKPSPVVNPDTSGFLKVHDGEKYAELLYTYCENHSLLPVSFTTWPVKFGHKTGYQSFLTLRDTKYGYKDIFDTSEDAEFSAAQNACIKLRLCDSDVCNNSHQTPEAEKKDITEERKVYLTPAQDVKNNTTPVVDVQSHVSRPDPKGADNEELKTRIKEILKSKTNGLWLARVPFEYKEKYDEAAPDNLFDIIKCPSWNTIAKVEMECKFHCPTPFRPDNFGPGPCCHQPVFSYQIAEIGGKKYYYSAPHTDREIVYPVVAKKATLDYKIEPPDKLPLQEKVTVYVTFIYDAGYFCVQREESCINYIQDGLEDFCEKAPEMEIENLKKGMFCAAQYCGSWSRAEIVSVSEDSVSVLYVDYGNLQVSLSPNCLKPLSKILSSEPAQAVNCSLYRTEPIGDKWCENSTKKLFSLVKEEPLIALTHNWNDDVCEVELFFPDNQQVSLNQLLVQDGLASVPLISGASSRTPSEIDESERMEPDPIELPEDNQWDVFVEFIDQSTEAVFIRLIGEEYSDKLLEFEAGLEEQYTNHTFDCDLSDLSEGLVCIALTDFCRVRILSIEDGKALCHYLDHGDKETLPLNALTPLDPAVNRSLPYQAIQCSLHSLEDFSEKKIVLEKLNKITSKLTFIAHIISRDNIISLVLINTHGEEDVNVNEVLLQLAMEDIAIDKVSGLSISENASPSGKLLKLQKGSRGETSQNISNSYIIDDNSDGLDSELIKKDTPSKQTASIYTWNSNSSGINLTDSDSGIIADDNSHQVLSKSETVCAESLSEDFSNMTVISQEEANLELFELLDGQYDVNVYKELKNPPPFPVPSVGELLDVHVNWISDCSNFVCLPYETLEELNDLMVNLNRDVNKTDEFLTESNGIAEGQIYAVLNENMWCRAIAKNIVSQGLISVYLVDFGEYSVVDLNEVKPLPRAYWSFPMQAIKCRLAGIEPVGGRAWSEAAKYKFMSAAYEKDFVSLVCHKDKEKDIVSLKLVDTSHDTDDVCIHEDLVRCGFAKFPSVRLKDNKHHS